jgi:hypothetical protein
MFKVKGAFFRTILERKLELDRSPNISNAFIYEPLPPRHIRLLNVSRTELTISHANLDDAPNFIALSYTWDGQQRDQDLICNGLRLKVTRNVLAVLPYLYLQNGPYTIWIDGICINQEDESEKSVQVPLMQDIYTKSSKVVIWLGESDAKIDKAMEAIPKMLPKVSAFDSWRNSDLASRGLPIGSSPIWTGIRDLLCRSWFTRLWVFQEAVLPDVVEFMCGEKVISRESMIELAQAIVNAHLLDVLRGIGPNPPGMRTLQVIETYKRWRSVGEHFSFGALVDMGRELSSQDSRDKIYGLLGLAEESLRSQIIVDYQNKTATELYLDVAKHEVANEPMVTLLHFANKRNNIGLPSWCPNYGEPPISTLLIAADYHAGTKDMIRRKAISARSTPFRATVDGNVLHIQGFRFDQVDKLVPPGWTKFHHDEENLGRNATHSLAWDEKCFELSQQLYREREEALDAHSRIIIGNTLNHQRCISDQRETYDLMKRLLAVGSGKQPPEHLAGKFTSETRNIILDYINNVDLACSNRTFFTTRDGRIGLGPSKLETGDLVCVMCNTFTPFIIRPRSGISHNELIGEAYVHGFMYGEVFDVMDEDQLETILLD